MKKTIFILLMLSVAFAFAGCDPGSTTRTEICNNGTDDDGDHAIDCADIQCYNQVGGENGEICQEVETYCDDGFDNDADGNIDCMDPDCSENLNCKSDIEICDNLIDDDGDNLVDCDDSDCNDATNCQVNNEICDNLIDDDGDNLIDCDDPNCNDATNCQVNNEICDNQADDDNDSHTDCADPDCDGQTGPGGGTCEATEVSCNDNYDNDGDGNVDCNDSDCAESTNCTISEVCDDSIDNDVDGFTDCEDPECDGNAGPGGGTCEITETSCGDNYDNDGDGNIDCNDPDCSLTCLVAGDLIITEFLKDPNAVNDSMGEWFEVYNNSSNSIDMRGLVIYSVDGSLADESHTISDANPVIIPSGGYAVFSRNSNLATNGNVTVLYQYDTVTMGNGDDLIGIRKSDGTIIDEVSYDETNFHDQSGMSNSLDPGSLNAVSNDNGSNWCNVSVKFNDSDYGTPGIANPTCQREANCSDNVDNDNNGDTDCADFACAFDAHCTSAVVPSAGDLLVTEIMADPGVGTSNEYEWFEIHNPTASPVEINGLTICDSSIINHCFFLNMGVSFPLAAGGYALFARDSGQVTGAIVAYSYGLSIQLSNSHDGINILRGEGSSQIIIDSVEYNASSTDWNYMTTGESIQFSNAATQDATVNNIGANWCVGETTYDSTNSLYGTPGSVNGDCFLSSETCDDGIDNDADTYTDCADPDCDGYNGPGGGLCETVETTCDDNYDNDGDGLIDSADSDCGGTSFGGQLYINELDADTPGTDVAEFIEIWNNSGLTVDSTTEKYFILLVNGSGDTVYDAFKITGSIAPDGVYVMGSSNVANVDQIVFTSNDLQNGADGAILVRCDNCNDDAAAEFPSGYDPTSSSIITSAQSGSTGVKIDAIAYDTNDSDDAVLMSVCGVTSQWNEGTNKDTESLHRTDLLTWTPAIPTPGVK